MTQSQIPDDTPTNLQEQILLEDARNQPGVEIIGGTDTPLRDAPRLISNYGGNPEDRYKIVSNQTTIIDGAIVEIHWYRNNKTGQNVEYKIKLTYLRTAGKN